MPPRVETGQRRIAGVEIPKGFGKLPRSVQEGIRDVVSLYKEGQKNPTRYTTVDEVNDLIPQINTLVGEHFDALEPFKKDMKWREVWKASIVGPAQEKAYEVKRSNEWWLHDDAMMYAPFGTYEGQLALAAGRWETIADKEGFERNPSTPLLKLFNMLHSYRSWAMVKIDRNEWEEMLVLRIPLRAEEAERYWGEYLDVLLPFLPDGPISEKAEFVVASGKPLHRVQSSIVKSAQMNELL